MRNHSEQLWRPLMRWIAAFDFGIRFVLVAALLAVGAVFIY